MMMKDMKKALEKRGISSSQLHMEQFGF